MEKYEDLKERIELAAQRIKEISNEALAAEKYRDFFNREAEFIIEILNIWEQRKDKKNCDVPLQTLKERNERIYRDLKPENYAKCYGNPEYAQKQLGAGYGELFSALYAELRGLVVYVYEEKIWDIAISLELFLECYSAFCAEEEPKAEVLKNILYLYNYDYCDEFTEQKISDLVDPANDFARNIVENADLNDLRYLYQYGEYVSENELGTAKFLNSLSEEEKDRLGYVIAEGYRKGFEMTNKDISKKKTVNIRYVLGFEPIIRCAIKHFRKLGLEPIIYRAATHGIDRRVYKVGYTGGIINRQYEYDHKDDMAIWFDESFASRRLSCMRESFEKRKDLANVHGGPACVESFGEMPFEPAVNEYALKLSEEQQAVKRRYDNESLQITNRYIIGEERSFTIIAFPIPEIGPDYEEIFRETVKVNTLDYYVYQKIQQNIIDALDKGERVRIKGAKGNETDITVMLHRLDDPEKQTNFENCVADVNIPVGEVFTSPVLKGTNGVLHVSQVYLNGFKYNDLKIVIKDGMAAEYTCANFDKMSENKCFIKENIMYRHDSLPVGEFAIGTNTTAYAMGKKFDISQKLPILIAEKTGPHFAFGDTCYSWEEDIMSYNPDGKAIIARENEISELRKEDPSKAYFGCHTDITIPYDELDSIYSISSDEEVTYIIKDGRFVLEGTQELNKAIDEAKNY